MVKMSVDFASEAPRCQRISSITPQITFDRGVIGGFSQGALAARFIRAATGRPKCPTRNIQIRPRNHVGFYWREIMTQEHQGMTAWATSEEFPAASISLALSGFCYHEFGSRQAAP
jgi:hypothetical protein